MRGENIREIWSREIVSIAVWWRIRERTGEKGGESETEERKSDRRRTELKRKVETVECGELRLKKQHDENAKCLECTDAIELPK